jgi:hypothetical protein
MLPSGGPGCGGVGGLGGVGGDGGGSGAFGRHTAGDTVRLASHPPALHCGVRLPRQGVHTPSKYRAGDEA